MRAARNPRWRGHETHVEGKPVKNPSREMPRINRGRSGRIHLMRDTPAMLRELNVVEQRYRAVLEVSDTLTTNALSASGDSAGPA
jgi:hypothetical protein